ncbi:ABC transporter substrate-binding protein [Glutamicibacter sp. NPDC087344]|uniref:ABC transporter substrate-binding protein n=1 Tax=Glutamicibacter sp. NPDC087344 TaxID=3363994 RepID=UPI00381E75EE
MTPPHHHVPHRKSTQRFVGATLLLTASALLASCAASGQASEPDADGTLNVRYEGAANSVTLPELAEDLGYLDGIALEWVGNNTSGPSQIQNTATNSTDIASAFTGAVVKLQEAGAGITGVVSSYGSNAESNIGFYALEGSDIKEPRDFIGKTVAVNTLGAHAEALIGTYLREAGLTEDEISQVQLVVLPPSDTEQAIRTGQVDAGQLSSLFQAVAEANGGLTKIFNDVEYFGEFDAGQYVLRDDFIDEYPEQTRTLVTGIGKAADWASSHTREEVIERLSSIIEGRDRGENTDALKYYKSYAVGEHGLIEDSDFTQWQAWFNDTGVHSGDINPSDYYTNEFNDLATEGK